MRVRVTPLGLGALMAAGVIAACLGDPAGPRTIDLLFVQRLAFDSDSVIPGAPGRPLTGPIIVQVRAADGRPVPGATVQWVVSGTNAKLDSAQGITQLDGTASVYWTLGTNAKQQQLLSVEAHTPHHTSTITIPAQAIPQEVRELTAVRESLVTKLGVPDSVVVTATDPYGNVFTPGGVTFRALDTAIVLVDSTGRVISRSRGYGRVVASAGAVADTAIVHVTQVVRSIQVDRDTLSYHSLGQHGTVTVTLLDELGAVVRDSQPSVSVLDTTVARIGSTLPLTVTSAANGATAVALSVGSVNLLVPVLVMQQATTAVVSSKHLSFDALTDTARLTLSMYDSAGVPLQVGSPSFRTSDTTIATVDQAGLVTSRANGTVTIVGRAPSGVSDTALVDVLQRTVRVSVAPDSLVFSALNANQSLQGQAYDRLGVPVAAATVQFETRDSQVAKVGAGGTVVALANGVTRVVGLVGADSASVNIRVQQRPTRVVVSPDTARFSAFGETHQVSAVALDSLGSRVPGSQGKVSVQDSAVGIPTDSVTLRAVGNGTTLATFSVDSLPASVVMIVQQVPDTVLAAFPSPSIQLANTGSPIVLNCEVRDRNGFDIVNANPSVSESAGVLQGSTCSGVVAAKSGFETVTVSAGTKSAQASTAVAVRPSSAAGLGSFLQFDTVPGFSWPWAPTAFSDGHGGVVLYATGYSLDSITPGAVEGSLYRYVSSDGQHFTFDGLALPRDSIACSVNGTGVENIAIVPRSDGPGQRMFYSSGGSTCYGWQVFSAVSTDGRTWTKEPGVRLSNGGTLPPAHSVTAPYPVGEGMVVDQLPDGSYRMVVGGFPHTTPPPTNTWEIAEWTSTNQLDWTYAGSLLSPSAMPAAGAGSVYSPTIVQVAPGFWRMFFTADARTTPGSRSAIWSAVSLDREHWQVEGQILGGSSVDLFYSTIVGNTIYYIRRDVGGGTRLASVQLTMP